VKTGKVEVISMDYKPLPIGEENFGDMITNGYYYVDKTLFIKELIDKKGKVNLFTRPRRFGKSLNISMIQYFFEKTEKDNASLFEGLHIMAAGEKYTSEMQRYPVIKLTLKVADQSNYQSSFLKLKEELIREFKRHSYLLESDKILDIDKSLFTETMNGTTGAETYSSSIKFLTGCLEQHHGEKAIVLIDEYDVPLEKAYFSGYYDEMIDFLRSLFNTGLKTNDSLHFAVMTGCLSVNKESIFTGFNNPKIIPITSSEYGEYFGFTEDEVKAALSCYRLDHKAEEAKQWYNGYLFGDVNVYNPWSIISYLNDMYHNNTLYPKPYWSNTSSNSIIQELITLADDQAKEEIEELIRGGSITKPIHEDVIYSEIKQNMDNLWNFLFFTGYLKKVSEIFRDDQIYFELKIPNSEVLYIYKRKIREWFDRRIRITDTGTILNAIIKKDTETLSRELNQRLNSTISYFDSKEAFYHGFLLGILSNIQGYTIKSNHETGDGRSDIYMKAKGSDYGAVIFELKITRKRGQLEKKCDEALKQIEEKNYVAALEDDGYKDIIRYGIAFYEKECMVKAFPH